MYKRQPLNPLQPVIEKDSLLFGSPYLKYTVGFDYTLPLNIYINSQWMHGFFTQRGDEITDFFMMRIERDFVEAKYKLGLNLGCEVVDWASIMDNYGLMIGGGITFKPHDNAKISLGTFVFDGKGNSIFARFKDSDMVMILGEFNF